ncbi:hypothetical protein BLNAU_1059 [Blattamonas nauphoetae]|uniref:Uncharacterized protein n=1 Tax=Blattamonas nauphoetae TaxID=2049346 RepID=A0ABQ9YJN9_9EUKA|nr:hypothetical protein BLNAU_1059 [Blattamonas nauphoetae]
MATVDSYNTPIALLTRLRPVAQLLSFINPEKKSIELYAKHKSSFENLLVYKLKTAEGEERWKLLTQLAVVARGTPDFAEELTKAENDAQALLILSVRTIRSTPRVHFSPNENPDAFSRIIELAGRVDNLSLVAAAMGHIGDAMATLKLPPVVGMLFQVEPKKELPSNVLNILCTLVARRREGVEEGCVVGKDEMTSQIFMSCLKVFQFLMNFELFDPTPFVDSLVSLAVTSDLTLLGSILIVLQKIEERTRTTATPFSISTITVPFRNNCQSSVTQQPLPSIVSSILLSASLDSPQPLSPRHHAFPPNPGFGGRSQTDEPLSPSQVLQSLEKNLISDIANETAENVCLILEGKRARFSRLRTHDDSSEPTLDQKDENTTPQQLLFALHTILLPDDTKSIPTSTFLPLAPFFTRILRIVVPSSTDQMCVLPQQTEPSQLGNVFVSLLLSLIHSSTPSSLSTPPLSSLLSLLSIAFVRIDAHSSSPGYHVDFIVVLENRKPSENRNQRDKTATSFMHYSVFLMVSTEGMNKFSGKNEEVKHICEMRH